MIFRVTSDVVELFSFKSYNIATAYLCIHHVLTTTKCDCCLLLLRILGKKLGSGTNASYFLLPMELT